MKNKVAILCVAHSIDNHFRLLINRLSPDFDVFIHFDKKAEEHYSEEIDLMKKMKNVHFINAIKTYWGGVLSGSHRVRTI